MVCMKSSSGVTTARTTGLNADQMPSGIPKISAAAVATSTVARLCMVSYHRPIESTISSPTASTRVSPILRVASRAIAANTTTMGTACSPATRSYVQRRRWVITEAMKSKKPPRWSRIQLITSSPYWPIFRSGMRFLPDAGQGGQNRGPRDDAGQPPVGVHDRDRDHLPTGQVHEIADDRIRLDGVIIRRDDVREPGLPAGDRTGQAGIRDDAQQPAVRIDDEGAVRLVVGEPAQRGRRVVADREGEQGRAEHI